MEAGKVVRIKRHGVDWYALEETDPAHIDKRIDQQFEVYRLTLAGDFNARLGEVLEIAAFRALRSTNLQSLGGFRQLGQEPTFARQKKEEPPSIFAGRELQGNKRFDFLVGHDGIWAGLEIKNIREWLYPDRDEIKDLLAKSADIDLQPILIGRRIPYVTRRLLSVAGVMLWETRNQYYPPEFHNLAGLVRDKNSLGYFDVINSDFPDPRLLDFISRIIMEELQDYRQRFEQYKDLLAAYGRRQIKYKEFAARLRRREAGLDEDGADEIMDIPF